MPFPTATGRDGDGAGNGAFNAYDQRVIGTFKSGTTFFCFVEMVSNDVVDKIRIFEVKHLINILYY